MEIEGLINHTLASALVEKEYIAQKLAFNQIHINFWTDIRRLHLNEEIKARLENVTHIRQLLGSEDYMQYMIENPYDAPLTFMGFSIKAIEFYIHLKQSMAKEELNPETNL